MLLSSVILRFRGKNVDFKRIAEEFKDNNNNNIQIGESEARRVL